MKNLIIIGSDVYARRVIKCIEALIKSGEEISIKGILDNNEEKNDVKGYKILDKIDNANLYNDEDTSFIIAIKNNKTRQEIADKFQEFDYYTVIHPKTHIGENVSIGKGSIIMDEVNIKDNIKIGPAINIPVYKVSFTMLTTTLSLILVRSSIIENLAIKILLINSIHLP